jgi:ectoine hydroxylase-related dioxygenase (phytanoyl-CoA dioxygenase family)
MGASATEVSRTRHREHKLSADQRQRLDDDGYLVIPDALSPDRIAALHAAIDRAGGNDGKPHNQAAILGRDSAFLDLIDLDTVLPKMVEILGWNIWVNHTHFNVNPPEKVEDNVMYGWHRDGGAIHTDLGAHSVAAPPTYMKVAFYLTDLRDPDHGQTYVVPGGHKLAHGDPRTAELLRRDGPWARANMPADAKPLCVPPGTAVLFHNRLVHSVRSPNTKGPTRRAIFIQWAYRWMSSVDTMDVDHLETTVTDPIRRQLLGLGGEAVQNDQYSQGRSRRYYPDDATVPLRGYMQDTLGIEPKGTTW